MVVVKILICYIIIVTKYFKLFCMFLYSEQLLFVIWTLRTINFYEILNTRSFLNTSHADTQTVLGAVYVYIL